jgi:predicted PurR-regulated permease PerM
MTQASVSQKQYPWRLWLIVTLVFFGFLFLIKSILLPFVVGILTAYFLDPAADRLEKWGASRALATAIITLCFFVSVAMIFVLIVPLVVEQLSGLLMAIPGYVAEWQMKYAPQIQELISHIGPEQFEAFKATISNVSGTLLSVVGTFMAGLLQSGMAIVNLLSLFFITPVVSFYLLKDWDKIVARVDTLLPRDYAATIREQIVEIDKTLAGFIRGQTNVCLFLSTFYAIGLSLAGLKFGLVIGIMTGMLAIIPYAGIIFGFVLGVGVALFQFDDMASVAFVIGVFMVGQFIEGNFVTPKLVGEKVRLHPVWIIFGMLAGAALFGMVGVLIAVPVSAVIGVLVRFTVKRYMQSEYYHGTAPRILSVPAHTPPKP